MKLKEPRDNEKYSWTQHVKDKMRFYGLSEQRVRRVLRSPERTEEGIAPNTVAVMQRAGSKKKGYEIWVMHQKIKSKIKNQKSKFRIISAWRYPGVSPEGKAIEIPEDVIKEVEKLGS